MKLSTPLFIALFVVASVASMSSAHAGAQASIKIEQLSASTFGSWTLLSADGSSRSSTDAGVDVTGGFTIGSTEFGQTTLSVKPPAGMSVVISVYRGGELLKQVTTQQYSFPLYANDNYRFLIKYSLTNVGSLGIMSDPNFLRFRMKGPTRRTYSAKTPHTFLNLPVGKYSLYFGATETCLKPAVQTVIVESEQRNTAAVTLTCNAAEEDSVDRNRISRRALRDYVTEREAKARGSRK